MHRRDLLTALAGVGAAAASRIGLSQTASKPARLGILNFGPLTTPEQWARTRFAVKLGELGWVEGRNLVVERAYGNLSMERLQALAADLVRKRVDVIYAFGPEAAVDAARATTTIPIVFWGVGFPIEQGLVHSYARPGRNATGPAWNAGAQMYGKLLEIAQRFSPGAVRVGNFTFPTVLRIVEGGEFGGVDQEMNAAARSLGIELRTYPVSTPGDFEGAFKSILAFRAQALITVTTWLSYLERQRILDFVARNQLVGLFDTKQFVDAGGLVSYGPDNQYLHERAAIYVDRVLRGARPAEVPVEQPTRFELHVNARTAKALGLPIPQDILLRADGVVGA